MNHHSALMDASAIVVCNVVTGLLCAELSVIVFKCRRTSQSAFELWFAALVCSKAGRRLYGDCDVFYAPD